MRTYLYSVSLNILNNFSCLNNTFICSSFFLWNSPFTTDDEFKNVDSECSLPFTVVTDINMKDVQSRLQAANEKIDKLKKENAELRDAWKIQHDNLMTIRSLITCDR
ncbi:unnamed protein product [Schistosoma curassoni]|nr:unnamed protein product [Schistosoma curassoni]